MSPAKLVKAFLAFVMLTVVLGTIAYYGKGKALGASPYETVAIMAVVSAVGVIFYAVDTRDE